MTHFSRLLLLLSIFIFSCKKTSTSTPEPTPVIIPPVVNTATYTSEGTFAQSFSGNGFKNPSQIVLKKTAVSAGYNSVYGFAVPVANQVKGFKWDAEDEQTEEWRPQGITGFVWGAKTYLAVTWYAISPDEIPGIKNEHKGVRLALIDITDMNNITYNYILLVQNIANSTTSLLYDKPKNTFTQKANYIPVTMHAGGLTYFNQKLYIADTSLGLRIFDLNQIVSAAADPTKNTVGKEDNGDLKAFNYEYLLPQSGYYKITDGSPFSCVALGQGASPSELRLWTAQYQTTGSVAKVLGYPIANDGTVSGPGIVVNPKDATGGVMYGMQGVYRSGNTTYVSKTGNSSANGSTARLAKYVDGASTAVYYPWPHGAEDLHLDGAGLLWSMTEYEYSKYNKDNRCVFAVRLADY
jgi:hypothetical protein